ncbi:protogenin [Anolis carolinensis]|uniref:protogenin n=1 Tax=Anolis carolinensis TaxID=28377 RepID=UPI002F2B1E1A
MEPPRRTPGFSSLALCLLAFLLPGSPCFSDLFFSREPQDTTVLSRREGALLECQARGEPPISVSWLRNGAKVLPSERLRPLPNGSLLVTEAHEGAYQCLALNQHGAILSRKALLTLATMPAFELQPLPAKVPEGGVARFACKVSSVPPAVVTWERNRTALPIALDRITALPSGVLQIYGVQPQDAGSYRCVATAPAHRRKSAEATLTVLPASNAKLLHKPSIIAGPENVTASLHQTVIFECVATGNPKPIISWSRLDHKPIDVFNTRVLGNGNLMISDVKAPHTGVYICRATTPGTRNFTTAAATLTVLAPPSFVEWPESLTRPRAGTARFGCQAEGIPAPKVSWLKNGRKVHSNGRIKMYNSKLVINQIIPEDDAIYQCLAENSQGSVLARARLTVVLSEDRPSAPCNVHAETVSSSAILLAWERPQYNADKVIAYSVHYMKAEGLNNEEYQVVIGNDTTHFLLDDLEPASNYSFYIVAYMPLGASQMSDHVTQRTLEDVPLRAPELSLTSRSPWDILVSWAPLPARLRRGEVVSFRLSFRLAPSSSSSSSPSPSSSPSSREAGEAQTLELPGEAQEHLLEGLRPDALYLVRIAAATRVGWGEASLWTSHRTPRPSAHTVPKSPELLLQPLNCTTIWAQWQREEEEEEEGPSVQGYKLFYKEEGQQESRPLLMEASRREHTISGLGPRRKYHVRLLAFNGAEEGYQADQTVSTPGCVSVRDRLEPPPPPPPRLSAQANSSSAVLLRWGRPAFSSSPTLNYTLRCHPVGLQNASLVRYLQTSETQILVQGLEPSTKYEFAVRLHLDQLASPWSPVVYHSTLPEAPSGPPLGVKVTLIEEDTALVSWKPPLGIGAAVSRYTILYASRKAWAAGQWQVLHREGTITMALLENLLAGNVYLVKIAASNEVGEGPFSSAVELAVRPKGPPESNQRPKRLDAGDAGDPADSGSYQLDQRSMTGIVAGVSIALACICACVLILIHRGKARKTSAPKSAPEASDHLSSAGTPPSPGAHEAGKGAQDPAENMESLLPRTAGSTFLDAKGGTDLVIDSLGPVAKSGSRKKWLFFPDSKEAKAGKTQRLAKAVCLFQPNGAAAATAVLAPEGGPTAQQGDTFATVADTEHSAHSETGDSGRFSQESSEDLHRLSAILSGDPCAAPKEPPDPFRPPDRLTM